MYPKPSSSIFPKILNGYSRWTRHLHYKNVTYPPVLHMYRQILRLAKSYPSIKRESVYEEIRIDFRLYKDEVDDKKVNLAKQKALFGISHLKKYVFDMSSPEWVVNLEEEPMPRPPPEES